MYIYIYIIIYIHTYIYATDTVGQSVDRLREKWKALIGILASATFLFFPLRSFFYTDF